MPASTSPSARALAGSRAACSAWATSATATTSPSWPWSPASRWACGSRESSSPAAACRRRWRTSRPSPPGFARTARHRRRGSVLPALQLLPVRIPFRKQVPEVVPPLPLRRGRRPLTGARHVRRRQRLSQPGHVARAVRVDLALHPHHELRAVVARDDLRVLDDRRLPVDAHAQRGAVEPQEEQADVRIAGDVPQRAVHRVAVVLGELDDVVAHDPDEAGIPRLDTAVDVVAPGGGNEEEGRGLDQLAVAAPERLVAAMALERVGDPAPVEAVLQLAAFPRGRTVP